MNTVDDARSSVTDGATGSGATEIAVDMPADLAQLPLLRSVAAALAVSLDFDIDAIADLRMAVDELVSTVAARACHGARMVTTLVAHNDSVRVTCTSTVADNDPVDEQSFGWTVLTTLADSTEAHVAATDSVGSHMCVALTMSPTRGAQ